MTYRRDPVPENSDDLRRFIDNEYRKIEDETDAIEDVLGFLAFIAAEKAIIRGSTTLNGSNILIDYAQSYIPSPNALSNIQQLISLDADAGTITVGYDGIYEVTGYVAQTEGFNNDDYVWTINVNGTSTLVIGTQAFTNQTNGSVFTASASIPLSAGDVLNIETISSIKDITVGGSNFEVRMTSRTEFTQV